MISPYERLSYQNSNCNSLNFTHKCKQCGFIENINQESFFFDEENQKLIQPDENIRICDEKEKNQE